MRGAVRALPPPLPLFFTTCALPAPYDGDAAPPPTAAPRRYLFLPHFHLATQATRHGVAVRARLTRRLPRAVSYRGNICRGYITPRSNLAFAIRDASSLLLFFIAPCLRGLFYPPLLTTADTLRLSRYRRHLFIVGRFQKTCAAWWQTCIPLHHSVMFTICIGRAPRLRARTTTYTPALPHHTLRHAATRATPPHRLHHRLPTTHLARVRTHARCTTPADVTWPEPGAV